MSVKTYKNVISETINSLGGRATVYEIYDFIEKNHKEFINGKKLKTWKNNVRYNLTTGSFYQLGDKSKINLPSKNHEGCRVCKYWYNNSPEKVLLPGEILQIKVEEALKFIRSKKEYREMMLDNYLEL